MNERTYTKEQAQKIITESTQLAKEIRLRQRVPVAVRVEDPGGGVYSVQVVDTAKKSP